MHRGAGSAFLAIAMHHRAFGIGAHVHAVQRMRTGSGPPAARGSRPGAAHAAQSAALSAPARGCARAHIPRAVLVHAAIMGGVRPAPATPQLGFVNLSNGPARPDCTWHVQCSDEWCSAMGHARPRCSCHYHFIHFIHLINTN